MHQRLEPHQTLDLLRKDLHSEKFNWDEIYIDGNSEKGLNRWAAYEIGYYLVKQKMKQTGKKASELFSVPSDDFL